MQPFQGQLNPQSPWSGVLPLSCHGWVSESIKASLRLTVNEWTTQSAVGIVPMNRLIGNKWFQFPDSAQVVEATLNLFSYSTQLPVELRPTPPPQLYSLGRVASQGNCKLDKVGRSYSGDWELYPQWSMDGERGTGLFYCCSSSWSVAFLSCTLRVRRKKRNSFQLS